MISTVQTPLPILAETAPKICPHFCAPSPASETISMVCSVSRATPGLDVTMVEALVAVTMRASLCEEARAKTLGQALRGSVVWSGGFLPVGRPGLA